VFLSRSILVWILFSHPNDYHAYYGSSKPLRDRIFSEIDVCKKKLLSDFSERPNIKVKFCFIDELLALNSNFRIRPDVVLFLMESRNFEDGIYDPPLHEYELKAYLKALKIPYTGCDGLSLFSDYDKSLQYSLAISCGIPVPTQTFISDDSDLKNLEWILYPAFVKPCLHGDSIGIQKSSIVHNKQQLDAEIKRQQQLFPHEPLVVQEYLEGDEYTVGIMGNWNSTECYALPMIKIGFENLKGHVSILTQDAKNDPESQEYMQEHYNIAHIRQPLEDKIHKHTLAIFKRLKCRGYARADWRLDRNGNPKFLEINALPDIMDDKSSIVKMYRHATNKTHGDFMLDIIKYATDLNI